jgi:molybdopterin converting factor small subunit
MTVRVCLAAQFAESAGGLEVLALEGATLAAVLRDAAARHPALGTLLWRDDASLNPMVVVFLNGQDIRGGRGLATPVSAGDEVLVLSAVEGG